jgi:tetratricopeptide (TPR) repeat protein
MVGKGCLRLLRGAILRGNSAGLEVGMIRLTTLSLLFCCLLALPAFAQKPATIAGNVYYGDDYHPANNVPISLYDSEHVILETLSTMDGGQFRFGGLKRASYELSVSVSGYQPATVDVDASFGSNKTITIYLKAIGDSKKQDAPGGQTVSVHELSMPAKAREYMQSGMKKLYVEKNAAAALTDFQQALSTSPGYYEADYQLAMAQLTLGNRGEAENGFRKAVEASGDKYAEADVGLGGALLDDGNLSEADKSIRRGLQLNPNLWLGHYELGRELLKENRLGDAQSAAEQAKQLAPSVPIVYRLLSNIHLQEKNYPALLEDLDAYLTLDPNSPAGVRAKEIRDQVQEQLAKEQPAKP